MVNVTFQPKHMSPWELQEEFVRSIDAFYSAPSALRIGQLFGLEYGLRRTYLAAITALAPAALEFAGDHLKFTSFYQMKHTPWKYAPASQPATAPTPAVQPVRTSAPAAQLALASLQAIAVEAGGIVSFLGRMINEAGHRAVRYLPEVQAGHAAVRTQAAAISSE